MCVEQPMGFAKQLLKLVNQFDKAAGCISVIELLKCHLTSYKSKLKFWANKKWQKMCKKLKITKQAKTILKLRDMYCVDGS